MRWQRDKGRRWISALPLVDGIVVLLLILVTASSIALRGLHEVVEVASDPIKRRAADLCGLFGLEIADLGCSGTSGSTSCVQLQEALDSFGRLDPARYGCLDNSKTDGQASLAEPGWAANRQATILPKDVVEMIEFAAWQDLDGEGKRIEEKYRAKTLRDIRAEVCWLAQDALHEAEQCAVKLDLCDGGSSAMMSTGRRSPLIASVVDGQCGSPPTPSSCDDYRKSGTVEYEALRTDADNLFSGQVVQAVEDLAHVRAVIRKELAKCEDTITIRLTDDAFRFPRQESSRIVDRSEGGSPWPEEQVRAKLKQELGGDKQMGRPGIWDLYRQGTHVTITVVGYADTDKWTSCYQRVGDPFRGIDAQSGEWDCNRDLSYRRARFIADHVEHILSAHSSSGTRCSPGSLKSCTTLVVAGDGSDDCERKYGSNPTTDQLSECRRIELYAKPGWIHSAAGRVDG